MVIPGVLETVSAPLTAPATGEEQRAILRMPDGMEYKEMEVAQSVVLKGTEAIKFDHRNTHSSMAEVEHTEKGLVAWRVSNGAMDQRRTEHRGFEA